MRGIGLEAKILGNRSLIAVIVADAVSGVGDWLYTTAMAVYIYAATADPWLVAVAMVGRMLPLFVLSIPAGLAADRWAPRRILVMTNGASAMVMSLMAIAAATGAPIGLFILCAIANSAVGTIAQPSRASIIPQIARDDEELGRANATYATLDGAAGIVGPTVAGVLILVGGIAGTFLINAATFAVVAVTMLVLPMRSSRPQPDEPRSGESVPVGWTAIVRRIWRCLALDGAISFAASALGTLTIVYVVERLHADPSFTGVIGAGGGVGAVAGGLATGYFVNRQGSLGIVCAVSVTTIAFLAASFINIPIPAAVLLGAATGGLVMLDALNMTAVQRQAAEGTVGRAFGVLHSLAALWYFAGSILPTTVAVAFGVDAALQVTAGAVGMLGVVAVARPMHLPRPRVVAQPSQTG